MTGAGDLRRLAMALADTSEAPHFDRAAFKSGRIYVTLASDGLTANFKFTPEEQQLKCLTHPAAFVAIANAWGRQGWTSAVLAQLSLPELENALRIAHSHGAETKKRR